MDVPVATTFDQYVAIIAANSPTATVLDCWRRLDLALQDYGMLLPTPVDAQDRDMIEAAIARDKALGQELAANLRNLRHIRNRVAHESSVQLSSEDATSFARQTFALVGALANRVSELEGAA